MATQADIDVLIDDKIRNYAVEAFHDLALNRILHLLNQNTTSSGPGSGSFGTIFVTSADFSDATNCPLPALNGYNIALFWNDVPKYLKKGTDWTPRVGGGFTILIAGFDATANAVNIVVTQAAV